MIAHIRKLDGTSQPLGEHCNNTALLCEKAAQPLGISKAAFLLGLLHDMGKATNDFSKYLYDSYDGAEASSPHYHSPAGAIYIYRRYFCDKRNNMYRRATAQILSLCIYGHHAGLSDCLNEQLTSDFLEAMKQASSIHYDEASKWFLENIISESKLNALFDEAATEIEKFVCSKIQMHKNKKICYFQLGMLTRLLLSILIDADRWDSACFEYGADSLATAPKPDWNGLFERFENFRRSNLNSQDEIGKIRSAISDECLSKAAEKGGIYTLCVPTGGGKTYSSLRYALKHAAAHKKKKIFYIIPYNTILDQNAQDIKKALSGYQSILEHHSNVIMPTQEEQEDHRRLTERWDSDIILTSLVQFLNACFSASNTDARRLFRLTDAVLIFDEIQSLPKHCKTLFEQAILFLSVCCKSTVILCTATQPKLDLTFEPENLIENGEEMFKKMKRVSYIKQFKKALHNDEAALQLAELIKEQSVLAIVNTKAVAHDVYQEVVNQLPKSGMKTVFADLGLNDEEIILRAKACSSNEVLCVHMSTLLCPAHRKKLIKWVKLWLKENARVFCISTALIEAGINVSFPVVVRSLAGLPSIVQAAGRSNRSMEYETGNVYIWEFCDEHLNCLADIQNGGSITRSILSAESSSEPDSPEQIANYFSRELEYINERKDYPFGKGTLFELLSDNGRLFDNASDFKENSALILRQSFRTAYREFKVIPQSTKPVIVPFEKGKELMERLESQSTMAELRFLLRTAQAYTVSLPESTFNRLICAEAIRCNENIGVWFLKDGYYDLNGGITMERSELELLLY